MTAASGGDDIEARARKLHFASIVVDTHDDTTQRFLDGDFDLLPRNGSGSIDIPRMKEGGLGAIFFSIWIPSKITGPDAVKRALDQIDAVHEQTRKHPKEITLATTAAEIREARKDGKIAALMGVEGGHMIASDLTVLRSYAALGVRYMTLTHSNTNSIGGSQGDEGEIAGLTDFGRRALEEMDRLGVMVDVSHVSDPLFWDVIRAVKKPVIASHSSSRELARHTRNMTDAMIKAVAKNGGAVCVNYWCAFLDDGFRDAARPVTEKTGNMRTSDRRRAFESAGLPDVPLARIADHIEHIARVGGIDHVCLGSDFDGVPMLPSGLEDVSRLPLLTAELRRRGFSPGDLLKILGENTLRVMAANEPR